MKNYDENMGVNKSNINWYPGHMAKTKREISEVLPLIDLVFEVVDARIPDSSRIEDIDNIVKNKPRIIVMTKSDLCDLEETNKWIDKDLYPPIGEDLVNYIAEKHLIKDKNVKNLKKNKK